MVALIFRDALIPKFFEEARIRSEKFPAGSCLDLVIARADDLGRLLPELGVIVLVSQVEELGCVGRVDSHKHPLEAEMAECGDVIPVSGVEQGQDAGSFDLH